MAELMLLSEIADPTRFFTDNLLSPEDWGVWSEAWGGERTVASRASAARSMEAEPQRGRPRKYRIYLPKEGGAGGPVVLSGVREVGETSAPCRNVELLRGREEGLKLFACITFHVGGRWVWPRRSNEGWSEGCVGLRRLGPWTAP